LKVRLTPSHSLHKTIHHAFFGRLVEPDGEFVAVDGGDVAVAEFQMKRGAHGLLGGVRDAGR
jgi:hypothetical protein